MTIFARLIKADAGKQIIWARAAAEEPDKAREIMDYASAKPQFETWSARFKDATMGKSLGNIRAMHNPLHLAGKVADIVYDDEAKTVDFCLKILDPVDWIKAEEGGYTGLSIGGGYVRKWRDPKDPTLTRYTPRIGEVSLVDAPCMPSATFMELHKRDGTIEEVLLKGTPRSFAQLVPPASFADLMKRSAAHPGFTGAARSIERKEGVSAAGAGAILAAGARRAGKAALKHNPRLRRVGGVHARKHEGVVSDLLKAMDLSGDQLWYHKPGWRPPMETPGQLGPAAARQPDTGMLTSTGGTGLKQAPGGDLAKFALNSPEGRAKVEQVMHEHKVGSLRSWRGRTASGKTRKGPVVENRKQAIAIALNQARRATGGDAQKMDASAIGDAVNQRLEKFAMPATLGLGDGFAAAGIGGKKTAPLAMKSETQVFIGDLGRLDKRGLLDLRPGEKAPKLGAAIGGVVGSAVGRMSGSPFGGFTGALAGAAAGHKAHMFIRRAGEATHAAAEASVRGTLSEKQREQRSEAAKSRWMKEGHHDLDDLHNDVIAHAKKALLGRGMKVAAAKHQRELAWHAVADTQEAYDKVRPHLPKHAKLMMEVHQHPGLLYNPEGVADKHFHANGAPKSSIYMLHPHEADDWIAKHGKGATSVAKMSPAGLIEHIRQIQPAAEIAEAA